MSEYNCTIGIGSNSPERERELQKAIEELKNYLNPCEISSTYSSPAQNGKDPEYLNAVAYGGTDETAVEIIKYLKSLERAAGRSDELKRKGIVPLDLDLVVYDNRILRPEDFQRQYFNIGYRQLLSEGAFETK